MSDEVSTLAMVLAAGTGIFAVAAVSLTLALFSIASAIRGLGAIRGERR